MNHVAGAQLASRRDRRAANGDAADHVAFALDRLTAFAANRPSYAASQLQIIIRGIDDGVGVHLGQVALHQYDFFTNAHRIALSLAVFNLTSQAD